MKKHLLSTALSFLLLHVSYFISAQTRASPSHLVRLYEDNDAINFFGKATDEAYTNGSRLDYYFVKEKPCSLLGKNFLTAGSGSVNTHGLSVMQVMITPRDYSKTYIQPNDYPYSGALFLTKSLHSSNPIKKYSLQTEVVAGIMGPYAYAGQTQSFIHGVIHNNKPKGWGNQLPTDILLNLNMTHERLLFHYGKSLEVIGGQSLYLGSMLDGASVYGTIRLGLMNPYFDGYLSQYSQKKEGNGRKFQCYLIIRPSVEFIARNSLLQGGMIMTPTSNKLGDASYSSVAPQPVSASVDFGLVVAAKQFSIALTEKTMTPVLRGLPSHTVGNLSLTFSW
jgi:hypothetical protein